MNEWKIKSESDTDTVLAEYDSKGRETGNYRYASKAGGAGEVELHVPGIQHSPRRWPWLALVPVAIAAGYGARALGLG